MKLTHTFAALGMVLATAMTPGCVTQDVGQEEQDAISLRDLYDDARNLDVNDLLSYAAGFATDELNDSLEVSDFASIKLGETELYALGADADNDLTLKNLDTLVSSLAETFGHKELTTEVNQVRRNHLASSGDAAYAESAFAIRAGLHNWGYKTKGFDVHDDMEGHARLGFDAGVELEARVIRTVDKEKDAYYQAPLAAMKETRGFVLPRGIADLQALKPGESYALRGQGRLGVNVGVGVPILVSAIDAFTYNLVMSAGLRTMMEGNVDVQLVKLDNNTVVVDVGIEKSALRQARIALTDGWGVAGLVEANVSIGPIDIDLGRLVEKAIQKELNKKLDLVDASYEKTKSFARLSVSRFRFDLSQATPGSPAEIALSQALKADVRLAQALANSATPGVVAEFELSRSGVSTTSYAGLDIFGMSFFRKVNEGEGEIVVQTPGGARTIYFESLHKESGWFLSSHGYNRVGLSSIKVDADNPDGLGEANLIFQITESDEALEKDKLNDHLDALILGIAGKPAVDAIELHGNELQRFVKAACYGTKAGDDCRVNVLSDPQVVALRQQGIDALAANLPAMDEDQRQMVLTLGEMRLRANATYEVAPGVLAFFGPPTSVVTDYRLDDGALDAVMLDHTRADFEYALRELLYKTEVNRYDSADQIAAERKKVWGKRQDNVEDAGAIFHDAKKRYRAMAETEELVLPKHPELGEMGGRAMEIRFAVSHDDVPVYEEAIARSIAKARAKVITDMVDELIDEIDGSKHGEMLAAYTLLQLTPTASIDLRFDMDVDVSDWVYEQYEASGYASFDVYSDGQNVSPIDGGMFDIEALIDID
jgi:hypothetical protein